MNDIIEKFTRCPQCRSFSIQKLAPENKHRLLLKTHYCENCSHKFTLKIENGEQENTASEHLAVKRNHRSLILAVSAIVVLTTLVVMLPGLLKDKPISTTSPEPAAKPQLKEQKISQAKDVPALPLAVEAPQPLARGIFGDRRPDGHHRRFRGFRGRHARNCLFHGPSPSSK